MVSFVPVNQPVMDDREKQYLIDCIDQGWLSSEGPFVRRFEMEMATSVGRQHGVAVSSGSAALEVAVAALDIGVGDEVIIPTFTIISSVAPVVRSGATPVLVDSDARTWNMDVGQVEACITARTKAIMVVHTYGLPADMEPILALAEHYNLAIIEDAAEAQGQCYRERPCGNFGRLSIFSFYANKHVTTGEGGMIVCDDEDLAERCRSFRNLCFGSGKRFVHDSLGWNYRMSNLQAAVGLAQLERLQDIIVKKRAMGKFYSSTLEHVPGLVLPLTCTDFADNLYWVYGLVLTEDVQFDAQEAMARLASKEIGTRPFFWPMHQQPVFLKEGMFEGEQYPVAEQLSKRGFYIPSGTALTTEQMESVCIAVSEVMS